MKQPILYSFVRFIPYFETGEFVNVGLLMCEPEQRKITYRLIEQDNPRVNHFFPNSLFPKVRETLSLELADLNHQQFGGSSEEMARFFHHYLDRKEGIVQYSQPAVGIVDDPQSYFDEIYSKFIQHSVEKGKQ